MRLIKWLLIGIITTAGLVIITGNRIILFIHAGLGLAYGSIAGIAIFKGLWQESKREVEELKKIVANKYEN